ncbi:hypothetical protein [Alloactinosynnema sp. L-07]|uniref:hypothetical protein n=1 Tax=Alloactinosynnema sp. L-07 TaxID=1653480 RepID=UPI00065F02DA|nr:hypothetical protein [Alloactinosynnema sp. L-07]CRK59029.1 hypothetical protein [Alloactinosynnema sp. L-07]
MTSLPALAEIARLQQTWRSLKPPARAALLKLKTDAATPVHHSTRAALRRRGLLDEHGHVTAAGALVVVHRPAKHLPSHRGAKRIVDVNLPEEIHA